MLKVSISQGTSQQPATINTLSTPMVQSTLQGGTTAVPSDGAVIAQPPSQVSPVPRQVLQVSTPPGQQPLYQVVTPPLSSPQLVSVLTARLTFICHRWITASAI